MWYFGFEGIEGEDLARAQQVVLEIMRPDIFMPTKSHQDRDKEGELLSDRIIFLG